MNNKLSTAKVKLWGKTIGTVADQRNGPSIFTYDEAFLNASGSIELAPIMMPKTRKTYTFSNINEKFFKGLPGMLADSLPDSFGSTMMEAYFSQANIPISEITPTTKLKYIGTRGMGALEYHEPSNSPSPTKIDIALATTIIPQIMAHKSGFSAFFNRESTENQKAILEVVQIGASAGGARAKAVVNWNQATGEFRSGQIPHENGFTPCLIKFDGVSNTDKDPSLTDPDGLTRVEYIYSLLAARAGIRMSKTHLFEENGRGHFITERFDRFEKGKKAFVQTMCALLHADPDQSANYGYEGVFKLIHQLCWDQRTINEMFTRMVFNVVFRNHDDHTKNHAFILDKSGKWQLTPAYDITYSFDPRGMWTKQHQMSINGSHNRVDFTIGDVLAVADRFGVQEPKSIIGRVNDLVSEWPKLATEFGVKPALLKLIQNNITPIRPNRQTIEQR